MKRNGQCLRDLTFVATGRPRRKKTIELYLRKQQLKMSQIWKRRLQMKEGEHSNRINPNKSVHYSQSFEK